MLMFNKYSLIELGFPDGYSFQYISGPKWFIFDSVLSFIFSFLKQVIK